MPADFSDGQRDQVIGWRRAEHGQRGQDGHGEHGQGGEPVQGGPLPALVMFQADLNYDGLAEEVKAELLALTAEEAAFVDTHRGSIVRQAIASTVLPGGDRPYRPRVGMVAEVIHNLETF